MTTVMDNFMCQPEWAMGYIHSILGIYVKVFLHEINTESRDQIRQMAVSKRVWNSMSP